MASEDAASLKTALLTEFAGTDALIENALHWEDLMTKAPLMDLAFLAQQTQVMTKKPKEDESPQSLENLAELIACAQVFDAWFEPVFNFDMTMTPTQASARQIFDLDGALHLPDGAFLIPRRTASWQNSLDDAGDRIGIFARYLRNVAYVPKDLSCDDPDALCQPGSKIASNYVVWNSTFLRASPLPDKPVIGVAPLAKRGSDVAFKPSADRDKYELTLSYDTARFEAAVRRTLDLGVHILLIPEMALPEGDIESFDDRIGDIIAQARTEHFRRTGNRSELRLIVAGVLGSKRDDGFHRNYAVAFDADGQRSNYQQLKLSHWNITATEQEIFGIRDHHAPQGPLANPIIENSLPASQFTIIDIRGVGRSATLICADMSQNNPGDWLGMNAMLDFLYAPIMDKSICWETSERLGANRPWIVRRSHRAALMTQALVIATNSMSLSRWVNQANNRNATGYPAYDRVGIGLAIDGEKRPPTFTHLLVDIDYSDEVGLFQRDRNSWLPFPEQPAT